MSDLKIVADPVDADAGGSRSGPLPVSVSEGMLTRRDLDIIKRDLITVRKDYNEIRESMMVLTHQYSCAPSRSFLVVVGIVLLALMAGLLTVQPQLSHAASRLVARVLHR